MSSDTDERVAAVAVVVVDDAVTTRAAPPPSHEVAKVATTNPTSVKAQRRMKQVNHRTPAAGTARHQRTYSGRLTRDNRTWRK